MYLRHSSITVIRIIGLFFVAAPVAVMLISQDTLSAYAVTILTVTLVTGFTLFTVLSLSRIITIVPLLGAKATEDHKQDDVRTALFAAYLLSQDERQRTVLLQAINDLFTARTQPGGPPEEPDAQPGTPPQ